MLNEVEDTEGGRHDKIQTDTDADRQTDRWMRGKQEKIHLDFPNFSLPSLHIQKKNVKQEGILKEINREGGRMIKMKKRGRRKSR